MDDDDDDDDDIIISKVMLWSWKIVIESDDIM